MAYYSEPERAVPVSRTPKELPRCETVAAIPDYSGPPVLWLHDMAIGISSDGIIMYRSRLGCYRRDSEYGWVIFSVAVAAQLCWNQELPEFQLTR